jgi:RAB protein geranylgeranyltransferase component A
MGIAGYVSICCMLVSTVFHCCLLQADKHISKKTPKKTRRKTAQEQNTNGKLAECDHVKKAAKKQQSKILKYMKNLHT